MAVKWDEEKIEKQKNYFMNERREKKGKFTEFTVRVYYNICLECSKNDFISCKSKSIRAHKIKYDIYNGIYDKPDHASENVIDDCVKHLKLMKYIKFRKINSEWYIYLNKPLDFLLEGEHERYMNKYKIENNLNYLFENN